MTKDIWAASLARVAAVAARAQAREETRRAMDAMLKAVRS